MTRWTIFMRRPAFRTEGLGSLGSRLRRQSALAACLSRKPSLRATIAELDVLDHSAEDMHVGVL